MARKLTGIRRKRNKWQAYVRVKDYPLFTKTFELSTPVAEMQAWRETQQQLHRVSVAPPGGSFADDIRKYLARHATMPTLAQRTAHLELWAQELGRDRRSDSITGDEIIATMNRWAVTPTVIGQGQRGRPSAAEGLSPATRRKRRTALQSFFTAKNGPGGYNPVKQVPIPETPKPEARHLDFATIERILTEMPDERSVKPGAPAQVSLASLRARVLAHTGIPPGLLQKIGSSDLVLVGAGAVRVRGRLKGAGVEARTIPLTAAGLAAFKAFHAANAYGRFSITALNRSFKRACERAGLDPSTVTLYDLRHSFLTQLYKTTRDLATVGRFGLHAEGSRVTARYAQGANRDVDMAAAAAMSADLAQQQRETLKAVAALPRLRKEGVMHKDEAVLVARMAVEMQSKAQTPMELVLRPMSVFQLTAVVQLALRHPGVTPAIRETAERFLAGVREYFADCPAVLDVVRRGDDPTQDRS